MTTSPYFGSLSLMVWPPAMTAPASFTFSAPPRRIAAMISGGRLSGKAAMFRANSGRPPIAYTSDSAFAAAMAP